MYRHPKAPTKGSVLTYAILFVVVIGAVVLYIIEK